MRRRVSFPVGEECSTRLAPYLSVSTIAPPSADLADAQPLCESLGQLRSVCSGLDEFMRGLFDELRTLYDDVERRRGDVDEMRRQLDGEATQLEKQRRQIDEQRLGLDEQREQLAGATQRLCDAKRELEEKRDADSRQVSGEIATTKKQLDEVRAECEQLREQRDKAVKQATQLASSAVDSATLSSELTALKTAVAEAKAEATTARSQYERAKSDLADYRGRLSALEADLADAQAQLVEGGGGDGSSEFETALRKQIQELINERSVVELQLESVRDRAAELTERLEEQDRQFAAERKRWQSELGEMSRLLTLNSRYGNGAPANLPPSATVMVERQTATQNDEEPAEPAAANPVVDSVMAQFRAVQKAAAKRRVGAK
jgi:chromosome segregation ATPase